MAALTWGELDKRIFRTGTDRGVLQVEGDAAPVAWNGLLSVDVAPSGGEHDPIHFQGVKVFDRVGKEDTKLLLECLTYPKAFERCDGLDDIYYNQVRRRFSISWRVLIGSAEDPGAQNYELHFVYGATALPTSKKSESLAASLPLQTLTYEIHAVPNFDMMSSRYPTAHIALNTFDHADAIATLEAQMYGSDSTDPVFPTFDDVESAIEGPVLAACLDLTTAEFNFNDEDPDVLFGEVVGTEIHATDPAGGISAYFPDFNFTNLDKTKNYRFTITFEDTGHSNYIQILAYPLNTPASWDASGGGIVIGENDSSDVDAEVQHVTVGPDSWWFEDWNSADLDWEGLSFETPNSDDVIVSICYQAYEMDELVGTPIFLPITEATTGVGAGALSSVIVGSGLLQDDSDSSYVDVALEVASEIVSGSYSYNSTKIYLSPWEPLTDLPPLEEVFHAEMFVRARMNLVDNNIPFDAFEGMNLGFHPTTISSPTVLTTMATAALVNENLAEDTAAWYDIPGRFIIGEPNLYEAIRTGIFPGFGEVGMGLQWTGVPATAPPGTAVGSRLTVRVYEVTVEIRIYDAPA